jgi:VCBS repeat-containing protein
MLDFIDSSGRERFFFNGTFKDGSTGDELFSAYVTVNQAPVSKTSTITTNEDTQIAGKIVATDVDSPTLTYSIVNGPSHGTLTLNSTTGDYVYTPAANYSGSDSFTFTANDGLRVGNNATVSINVVPVNDAPVSQSLTLSTSDTTPLTGKLPVTDIDSTA